MRRWLRLRLLNERGMALVMAIGMTSVLGIAGTTAMVYSTSNSTESVQSSSRQNGFSLAEAGINNAMSVLSNPTNNSLEPDLLPNRTSCATNLAGTCTAPYGNGYVVWGGTLDRTSAIWTLTSTGYWRNVSRGAAGGYVSKKLTAKVTITPAYTQPANNPAWNYMFSTHTGSACDETLNNNVSGGSRMYIAGNLCLNNNVTMSPTSLLVQGNLDLSNNAAIGASTSMSTRVETYVGGNCRYGGGAWASCTGNQDARHVYSKMSPPSYVVGVNHTVPLFAAPQTDYNTWYENSIPGPKQDCSTKSGTTPVFDNNYPTRDNSVSTVFNLTPATSYTCLVGTAQSPSGELAWNATTKVLTVAGTIFIDGSATVTSTSAQYNGQASLYLSGTFLVNGKLCGGMSAGNCDVASWNPNTEMLTVVTNSTGGQCTPGDGIQLANSSSFQGALYSSGNIELGNNSWSDGPMVGAQIILSNNVITSSFGTVTTVPVGQPGNPAVYAQPNPPQMFSG